MAARSSAPVLGALCGSSDPVRTSSSDNDENWWSAHHWTIEGGYRYQHSFRHFVGTTEQVQREQQGTQVVNYINLFDVSVTYRVNPRWSLSLGLPILVSTRTYDHQLFQTIFHIPNAPDQVSHGRGIGDLSVSAQFWVVRPPSEKGRNIAFTFGAAFPTGDSRAIDTVQTVNGPQRVFVDQSIQPGSGGYGILVGTQAFQRVKRAVLFGSASYLVTPQEKDQTPTLSLAGINIKLNPLTSTLSIPDQYLAEGGVAYPVPKIRGLAAKFGLRYEGVKVKDLIGGSLGFRRPGYAISVAPGLQYEHRGDTFSLSIPVAVQRNRKRSVPDQMVGGAGDAAFADYLILVGFAHRF